MLGGVLHESFIGTSMCSESLLIAFAAEGMNLHGFGKGCFEDCGFLLKRKDGFDLASTDLEEGVDGLREA